MAERLLVITGPTASGKTCLALEVARRLTGEIVSMDSRQVYRGMDIGTAKPTFAERQTVPHHGLDLVDPDQRYSAGQFARDARRWIDEIRQRDRIPIVVGGTGFFLRALVSPLFVEPGMDEARRGRLQQWLAGQPREVLRRWAARLDPAASVDPQRQARRIEIALLTGYPLSRWQASAPAPDSPLNPLLFLLELPRDELYRRIDDRVRAMIADGLVDEVRELLRQGFGPPDPGMTATGYIQLMPYLHGDCTLEEAIVLIQNATRGFARRQLTWFRGQLPEPCCRLDGTARLDRLADRVVAEWGGRER